MVREGDRGIKKKKRKKRKVWKIVNADARKRTISESKP